MYLINTVLPHLADSLYALKEKQRKSGNLNKITSVEEGILFIADYLE